MTKAAARILTRERRTRLLVAAGIAATIATAALGPYGERLLLRSGPAPAAFGAVAPVPLTPGSARGGGGDGVAGRDHAARGTAAVRRGSPMSVADALATAAAIDGERMRLAMTGGIDDADLVFPPNAIDGAQVSISPAIDGARGAGADVGSGGAAAAPAASGAGATVDPVSAVPEPASWAMFSLGFAMLGRALRVRSAGRRRIA